MKKLLKLTFAIALLFNVSLFAQSNARNLQDLVGVKGSSAENELENRGYVHIKTNKSGYDIYSSWWNWQKKKCITYHMQDGRIQSVVNSMPYDCNKNSNGRGTHTSNNYSKYNSYNDKYYSNNNSYNHHSNNQGQTYNIRSQESGLVLDANMHNSDAVSVWKQHGGANQKWIITHMGGDEVTIENVGNGKCLTASSSSKSGASVAMKSCSNSNTQKWYLERLSSNEYIIRSNANSKVLDVSNGKHNMTTFERNGSSHQKWILEKTY